MLKSLINSPYIIHEKLRCCQGDILRDFTFKVTYDGDGEEEVKELEINFDYIIIISQDCDLENRESKNKQSLFTQFLPNIMFLPAFPAEKVKEGSHLKDFYGLDLASIDGDIWKRIKRNHDDRYHYFQPSSEFQITDLVVDFKNYHTTPIENILKSYDKCYLATLNELFREHFSQRFSNFISRIGLPDLRKEIVVHN